MNSFLLLSLLLLCAYLWGAQKWLDAPYVWEFFVWIVLMTSIAMGLSEHVEQLWAAVGAAGILSVGLTYRIGIKSLSLQISLRALTLALIVAFIQLVVSNVWIEMLILLNVELEPQKLLLEDRSLALILYVTLAAPLFEEFLFRGFLLPSLLKEMSVNKAIFCNGVAFGLMHWSSLQAVPPLICFGVMLSYLRWREGSTSSCIVAHVFNNTVVLMLL